MPTIHPTAIVDRRATLADDVTIGPACVIDGPAVIGAGTRLIGHVYLHGKVTLGQNNTVYPFACIGFEPQDRKFKGDTAGVVVGDRNLIREGVTLHCASIGAESGGHPTTLGSDNMLMNNSHMGHDSIVANHCTLAPNVLIGGHAQVADAVTFGGNSGIGQHSRVGRLAFLGGVSSVTADLPPFTMATGGKNLVIGLNVVGLRRAGVERAAIDAVKLGFEVIYLRGHTNPVAIGVLEQMAAEKGPGAELLQELATFIRASKRGLCPHALRKDKD